MFNKKCVVICSNKKELETMVDFCNTADVNWCVKRPITLEDLMKNFNKNIVYWIDDDDKEGEFTMSYSTLSYLKECINRTKNNNYSLEYTNMTDFIIYKTPKDLILKNMKFFKDNKLQIRIL